MSFERMAAAWPLLRDIAIVMTALGLIVFEATIHDGPVRQELMLAYVGLLASPVFLRKDEKDRRDREEQRSEPQESDP